MSSPLAATPLPHHQTLTQSTLISPIQSLHFSSDSSNNGPNNLLFSVGNVVYKEESDANSPQNHFQKFSIPSQYCTSIKGIKSFHIPDSNTKFTFYYGQKMLALTTSSSSSDTTPALQYLFTSNARDWIMELNMIHDANISEDPILILGYPHNSVELFRVVCETKGQQKDSSTVAQYHLESIGFVAGPRNCLLYSMAIVKDPWYPSSSQSPFLIASGTIFGQISIWNSLGQELVYLQGHEGSIFSVTWNRQCDCVASTSDDRTVRYWRLKRKEGDSSGNNQQAASVSAPPSTTFHLQETRKMYGHHSRVWDCCFLERDNLIVSSGEDATIRFWDIPSGNCVHILKGHFVKSVWKFAISPDEKWLASAGGDASVKMWPLDCIRETIQQKTITEWKVPEKEGFKKHAARGLTLTTSFNSLRPLTILVSNSGSIYGIQDGLKQPLLLYDLGCDVSPDGPVHPSVARDLSVYITNSPCGRYIASTSAKGVCTILSLEAGEDATVCGAKSVIRFQLVTRTKPLSLYWFSHENQHHIIVALPDGRIRHFALDAQFSEAVLLGEYRLVKMSTYILFLVHRGILLVGDKSGNLHMFHAHNTNTMITSTKNPASSDAVPLAPYFSLNRLHAKIKIASIAQGPKGTDIIYSMSVDGTLWRLRLEPSSSSETVLVKENVYRLFGIMPHIVYMYISPKTGDIIIAGFHGSYFVLYNLTQRCRIVSMEAGGVRRLHSIHYSDEHGYFVATAQRSELKICRQSINNNSSKYKPYSSLFTIFHGRGQYAVHSIPMYNAGEKPDARRNSICYMTASEDCTVRLTEFALQDASQSSHESISRLHPVDSFEMQDGPTRTISSCPRQSTHNQDNSQHIAVIGGSKEQLSIYGLKMRRSNEGKTTTPQQVSNLGVQCHPDAVQSSLLYYQRITEKFLPLFHPNLVSNKNLSKDILFRIMSSAIVPIPAQEEGSTTNTAELYLIALGGSDAKVKFFLWDMKVLIPVGVCQQHSGVVKKMHLSYAGSEQGRPLLCTAGTDSKILCFDLSTLMQQVQLQYREGAYEEFKEATKKYEWESEPLEMTKDGSRCVLLPALHNVEANYHSKQLHQSGVNALHSHWDEKQNQLLIFSGGDDQNLILQVLDIQEPSNTTWKRARLSRVERAHSSTVTGVFTDGEYCFSTSTDQRVNVYRCDVSAATIEDDDDTMRDEANKTLGSGVTTQFSDECLQLETCSMSCVADVMDMDVQKITTTGEQGPRTKYQIAALGCGMELFEYNAKR